jgi:hypothetical protein
MKTAEKDWQKEFGLDSLGPPYFFSDVGQLDGGAETVPQPHALRRAFEEFQIDGVLCQERSPLIFFREVDKIDLRKIAELHRLFWNQGIAPLLVVVAPDEVQIYSGLIPPDGREDTNKPLAGFIEKLDRVTDQLRSFLLSVESGNYFHVHARSFDPNKRVDRTLLRNLEAARQKLDEVEAARLEPQVLDALLCRLVFSCYLFDRGVIDDCYLRAIGISDAKNLKDLLSKKPRSTAKAELYGLFKQLGADFNGDLFSADLEAEARQIKVDHLEILDRFFSATEIHTGQLAFWPYDFGVIPIETISAIYEHFLKAAGNEEKKQAGAFYTPRFLAEFVLDLALQGESSLLNKRFLDPSCGSGIFLVGLFNRIAEEWKLANLGARYDRRAKGLMDILRNNLFGVDRNRSACQITAFSLYLAFLDQLSPPDIQKLLGKWDRLPNLVSAPDIPHKQSNAETIHCADFFDGAVKLPQDVDFVVGNPPWGSEKDGNALAVKWCTDHTLPQPDRQMAVAFTWKGPTHLARNGKACFVLPHGILFNHNDTALQFQRKLLRAHALDTVVNLTDYQFFLFEESRAPALVMRYRKAPPENSDHRIGYLVPKTDWSVTQAEILTVYPQDRTQLPLREVLENLNGHDALIWKERSWATPRDQRFLDRMTLMRRLRDLVGQASRASDKRWIIAEGFQPLGANDDPKQAKTLSLPSSLFIDATSPNLNLFLTKEDCTDLTTHQVAVRGRSNKNTQVFKAPHVLVAQGFSHIAFAGFDVSFRHALRGIHGPEKDRNLLLFLAAYLRSQLARYFLFHTSSNWGVSRAKVHVEELLRLPFLLPGDTESPERSAEIIQEVANIVKAAERDASKALCDREDIVDGAQKDIEALVNEYFDIDKVERALIADTCKILIPSVRPSRSKPQVPTLIESSEGMRESYEVLLCEVLNSWANSAYTVSSKSFADSKLGIGLLVLEKTERGAKPTKLTSLKSDVLATIQRLQKLVAKRHGVFELIRNLKVFEQDMLFICKPLAQRFWTQTAALNDADEIAATILMQRSREK